MSRSNERRRGSGAQSLRRRSYVVKDPWLFSYCDQVDTRAIDIDVLLVPVRELMAASTSRVLQERISMAEEVPWSTLPTSDVHGVVAGGAIYSLDPVDEARLLGFHRLIHWAIVRSIPLILLEFPRIVVDAEYLVDTLWPWLGEHCTRDHALAAFAAVADPDQLRIEGSEKPKETAGAALVDSEELDRAALRVLLAERVAALEAARGELAGAVSRLVEAERRVAESESRLDEGERRAAETERNLASGPLPAAQDALARESSRSPWPRGTCVRRRPKWRRCARRGAGGSPTRCARSERAVEAAPGAGRRRSAESPVAQRARSPTASSRLRLRRR